MTTLNIDTQNNPLRPTCIVTKVPLSVYNNAQSVDHRHYSQRQSVQTSSRVRGLHAIE